MSVWKKNNTSRPSAFANNFYLIVNEKCASQTWHGQGGPSADYLEPMKVKEAPGEGVVRGGGGANVFGPYSVEIEEGEWKGGDKKALEFSCLRGNRKQIIWTTEGRGVGLNYFCKVQSSVTWAWWHCFIHNDPLGGSLTSLHMYKFQKETRWEQWAVNVVNLLFIWFFP